MKSVGTRMTRSGTAPKILRHALPLRHDHRRKIQLEESRLGKPVAEAIRAAVEPGTEVHHLCGPLGEGLHEQGVDVVGARVDPEVDGIMPRSLGIVSKRRGAPDLGADELLGKVVWIANLRVGVLRGDGAQHANGFGRRRHLDRRWRGSVHWRRVPPRATTIQETSKVFALQPLSIPPASRVRNGIHCPS